ncbi:MAG: hypothetical protein AAGF45_05185 [Pseudomonadota bacterium]
MSTTDNEIAALGRQLQNFFNAVDWRTDARVQDAAFQMECLHGATAALEAVARACEAMATGEISDCEFWFKVFGLLASPHARDDCRVTVH